MTALEIAVDRIAVPMLRPKTGAPPGWHKALDYAGLFLHNFVAVLAVALIAARCTAILTSRQDWRDKLAHAALAIATAFAAVPLLVSVSSAHTLLLEAAFSAAVILLVVSSIGCRRDLGVQIGMFALAAPLLLHTVKVVGTCFIWPIGFVDEVVRGAARGGEVVLILVALVSPYIFAPRPLFRAMTRPWPVVVALAIAGLAVGLVRAWYPEVARAATLATGVQLRSDRVDPGLALYILALATLAWTLASCAIASAEARRRVGQGLALVVFGGYAFRWPHHYLLPLLGLALIADAARRVREQEIAALPVKATTPAISDAAWSSYLSALKPQLEAALGGGSVHTLTTRGDNGLQTSLIVGDQTGIPIRARIERLEGSVISLDVVAGREVDELSDATLSLRGIGPRSLGAHPDGPPAAPRFSSDDPAFDERFRSRGSALVLQQLFDAGLRARAAAALDGWLAYWDGRGVRYRVYPGLGAPLDHPLPLSELALGRPATPDRLVAVIMLVIEIAARGIDRPVADNVS